MSAARSPVALGALAATFVAAFALGARLADGPEALDTLERWSLDLRFRLRGPRPAGDDVVILAFDDATEERAPTLFTRRAGWARVLDALRDQGAKVIGVDAFFAAPEVLLDEALAADVAAYLDAHEAAPATDARDALLARVHEHLSGDQALEEALKRAPPVVLAAHVGVVARGGPTAELASASYGQVVPGVPMPSESRASLTSLPRFSEAAAAQGMVTLYADADQTVRELVAARSVDGRLIAPLAAQLVALYEGVGRERLGYVASEPSIRIGPRAVSVEDGHALLLNFRGPRGTFPTYSVIDLVEGKLPEGALEDRIVLLGLTHLGHDTTRTPFGALVPGVEVHATAVSNLLRGDPLRRAAPPLDALFTLVVGLLLAGLFLPRLPLSPSLRALGALVVLAAALALAHGLFARADLWVSALGPVLAALVVTPVCLTAAYLREGIERLRTRRAFAHYLADDVIEELLETPGALTPGGARRELTVLFSDIRGFTTLSEELSPEELVRFLNGYLTPMTRAVLERGGYLDKYVGDAIMAVFGAPVPYDDHGTRALLAALEMHRRLADVPRPRGGARVAAGVGINTGDMIVGNMGSLERFDYTVIGDAVNLASRLEGLTKGYGVFCVVGDATRRAASPQLAFREIDLVRVKGRSAPVAIHELLSGPDHAIARYAHLERFEEGIGAWRAGDFATARRAFAGFLEDNPDDSVAALYLARLDELGAAPPPDWDGVFTHREK